MNVLLLAAGEGTRFRPHTLTKPKPAIPFLNVPLAFYSLSLLDGIRVDRLIVNTFHLPNHIVDLFKKKRPYENLFFSHELNEIQGSGGALKHAQNFYDSTSDILVLNGDEVILPTDSYVLQKAVEHHHQSKNIATLLVIEHPEVGSKFGGVWIDKDQNILDIGKSRPPLAAIGYHFIGVAIYSQKILQYLPHEPSHIFKDALLPALKNGEKAQVYPIEATWFETGNLRDYLNASKDCLSLLGTENPQNTFLKKVIKTYAPSSHWNQRPLSLVAGSIPKDLKIDDFAVIGENVQFQGPTHLQGCVIDSYVKIDSTEIKNELLLLKS